MRNTSASTPPQASDQGKDLGTIAGNHGAQPPGPEGGPPRPIGAEPPGEPPRGLEQVWAELEAIGRLTGHVLVACPGCSGRAMVSIVNTSGTSRWVKSGGGWPKCKQCRAAPRVEPIGDVTLVARIKPGHMATKREAARYRRRLAEEEAKR